MTKRKIWLSIIGAALVILFDCGTKVMVPPKIDLRDYNNIGMIEFSSNTEGNLQQFATQKFLQAIQSKQPGVRVLELGNEERVLKSIQHNQLDLEAIKTIGKKYNIETVITGRLDVTDVKPKVEISSWLKLIGAQAVVEASLSVRLLDTERGTTLWTNSAEDKETVAGITIFSDGPIFFDASDPEEAYGKLVQELVNETTRDFQARYERR